MSLLIFLLKRKRQCTNAPLDTASTKQEAINKVLDNSDIQVEIVSSIWCTDSFVFN